MSSTTTGAGLRLECWIIAVLIGVAPALVRAEDGPAAPENADTPDAAKPAKPARAGSAKKELPSALLLATAGEPDLALDSVIQAELEKLGVVKLEAVPGLDLHATQLALDCVGETAHCLKRVTSRSRAQVLIAPTLQRTPSELVLSLLRFDEKDGTMRRSLRRHAGTTVESGLLDLVPEMLRELFDLPRLPPKVAETTPPPEATAPDPFPTVFPPDEPPQSDVPVGPIVLASVGVAALAGGIAMGVVMKNNKDEYERLSRGVDTRAEADAAVDVRDSAETQEVLANVLLAAGGATIVAAGIWLGVELSNAASRESASAFAPVIGPNQAGLVFLHRGDAL